MPRCASPVCSRADTRTYVPHTSVTRGSEDVRLISKKEEAAAKNAGAEVLPVLRAP